MSRHQLLVEIGTEELPPATLPLLASSLTDGLQAALTAQQFVIDESSRCQSYFTPRRLATAVSGIGVGEARRIAVTGPPLDRAFDAAENPTAAAVGFSRKQGVPPPSGAAGLTEAPAAKQSTTALEPGFYRCEGRLLLVTDREPPPIEERLTAAVQQALATLPPTRTMRWGDSNIAFARPVRWVIILLDQTLIETQILGVQTDRFTRGHRFMAGPEPIRLEQPQDYLPLLHKNFVIADPQQRRQEIVSAIEAAATTLGGTAVMPPALIDEVSALTEWPVAVSGPFDPRYLELPAAVLLSVMQKHQRFFAVEDAQGALLPHFITVANLASSDPAVVSEGNTRVLRSRLEDAVFFYRRDCSRSLRELGSELATVVFAHGLGSLQDKTDRIGTLAASIAERLGTSVADATAAAALCKADLLSELVGEFDSLQGIMGAHYAAREGQNTDVAQAIAEHYLPRGAGDTLPETACGCALALADRLDSLSGFFGIGKEPSSSSDPFALRRAALGVVRIVIERSLDLDLAPLLQQAGDEYRPPLPDGEISPRVLHFIRERQRIWYQERGYNASLLDAVFSVGAPGQLLNLHRRLIAVDGFCRSEQATNLVITQKRVAKLFLKQGQALDSQTLDETALQTSAEQELIRQLRAAQQQVPALLQANEYQQALELLAALQPAVDQFFEAVLVMDDNPVLRENRLKLLGQLRNAFMEIADLSRIDPNRLGPAEPSA